MVYPFRSEISFHFKGSQPEIQEKIEPAGNPSLNDPFIMRPIKY